MHGINNLNKIDSAKEQMALDNGMSTGDAVVDADVNAYMKKAPECPANGTYTYNAIGTDPVCDKAADGHVL